VVVAVPPAAAEIPAAAESRPVSDPPVDDQVASGASVQFTLPEAKSNVELLWDDRDQATVEAEYAVVLVPVSPIGAPPEVDPDERVRIRPEEVDPDQVAATLEAPVVPLPLYPESVADHPSVQ
jgi:hypothetical protein